jgi:hypothetical protein
VHPSLRCSHSYGDRSDTDQYAFRYCTGRVDVGRYLYLGQDPVSVIAVANVPLGA